MDQPRQEPSSKPYDLRLRSQCLKTATQRRHPPPQRPKSVLLPVPSTRSHRVRFEEALEADATRPMGRIRKKLNKENRKQSRQKEVRRYVYESNLQEAQSGLKKQMGRNKTVFDEQDAEYKKVFSGPKTSKYQPANKYSTKVTTDRLSRSRSKAPSSKRKRSASSSPTMHRHKRYGGGGEVSRHPSADHEEGARPQSENEGDEGDTSQRPSTPEQGPGAAAGQHSSPSLLR